MNPKKNTTTRNLTFVRSEEMKEIESYSVYSSPSDAENLRNSEVKGTF